MTNDKILDWSKLRAFADDKLNVTKFRKSFWKGWKTLLETEKLLVTVPSIFSFSHNVFKSCLP